MVSPRRTRSSNATKHPGALLKGKVRRSSVEVQAEAEGKAAAKAAKQEERNARIRSIAEFEREAMGREDATDATPQPNFASTKRSSRNYYDELDLDDVDEPNPDGDTYLPPDGPADEDIESEDLAKTVDATPVPARKRKKKCGSSSSYQENKAKHTRKPQVES